MNFIRRGSSFGIEFNRQFSARIDSKPNLQQLKTADLQKGLILIRDGREIVNEGMGFGVPVVKYSDKMFFSKKSNLVPTKGMTVIKKDFHMDSIEQIKVGKHVVSRGLGGFAYLYRSSRFFRKPMIKFSQLIKKMVDVKSEFETVAGRGLISVTYRVCLDRIHVNCDMTKLDKSGCKSIFILNEQGSSFFKNYNDSDGVHLVDDEIGAWDKVKAKKACLFDLGSSFSFCLKNTNNVAMWRGRETQDDTDWAGLIYEIPPSFDYFDYDIFLNWGVS